MGNWGTPWQLIREMRVLAQLPNYQLPTYLLAAVVLLTAGGCPAQDEPLGTGEAGVRGPVIQGAVVEVRTTEVPLTVEVTGRVTAVFEATLSSKVQGIVRELRAREGSHVKRGEVLVVLDSRELRAGLAGAQAEVESARTHLARMQRLFEEDSVARQELDEARRAFKVAQASREEARARLSYTVTQAPFRGVIADRLVEVGELASPGQPLLRLEDPRQLQLEATVAERDVKAITEGDRLPVIVDALDGEGLEGTVTRVLPSGDPATHTFLVKVALPSTPGLKSSMFGRMHLTRGTSRTILLPEPALVERGQLTGVYVVGRDHRASLRWVKLGRLLQGQWEVIAGLNPGELVLADARQGKDGALVEIVGTSPAPTSP